MPTISMSPISVWYALPITGLCGRMSRILVQILLFTIYKMPNDCINSDSERLRSCVTPLFTKIKRSITRHSTYGTRGYYDFIKNYV